MQTAHRINELRKAIEAEKLDALLVSSVPNVSYLSGFTGDDSLALISPGRQHIVTDFRYAEQVEQQCPGWQLVVRKDDLWSAVSSEIEGNGVGRLGFESVHLSHRNHGRLAAAVEGVELVPLTGTVEKLREIKDAEEVEKIQAAVRCQEAAFNEVKAWLEPGVTEKEVAREIDDRMRRHGAERFAFETVVAAGERASLPHAQATERVVAKEDTLLIDWGARRFFYNSDLTRVLCLGSVNSKFERIYETVRHAQERALAVIRPGVRFSEVDEAARGYIRERGYGERFGHALGHGVGLEVHESPLVREKNEERLVPGMVFTVEPGIYIPGWGGVRIEDMVLVTARGVQVLSTCDKDLDKLTL